MTSAIDIQQVRYFKKISHEQKIRMSPMRTRVNPTAAIPAGITYAANFGPERSQRLVPLHTFLKNGIQWGGGSDYSVTPLAARYGLWASVERETLKRRHRPQVLL
jgi:predicted amidohydrolase YtcJ